MRQVMQRRRFPAEQRKCGLILGHVRQQHLDRDGSTGLDFVRLIDLAHAAGADHFVYFIDPVEARARRHAAITRREWIVGAHCCPTASCELVGSEERRTGGSKRIITTVTLSRPPRSSASANIVSQDACALRAVACRRISSSSKCLVRPSLQMTKISPGSTGPVTTSSSRSSPTP